MTKRETYEQKTEALLAPLLEEHRFELVDVEFVKEAGTWFLRAYIDKPGGITIDDCELVSRALSDLLDEKDFIEETYILEVSSPGLGRPLKKDRDFERSLGESVEVRLYRAIDRQKEFTGILKAWNKETVTLEFEDEAVLDIDSPRIIRRDIMEAPVPAVLKCHVPPVLQRGPYRKSIVPYGKIYRIICCRRAESNGTPACSIFRQGSLEFSKRLHRIDLHLTFRSGAKGRAGDCNLSLPCRQPGDTALPVNRHY